MKLVTTGKSPELSNENVESGTPPEVIAYARYVMGDIDLDPASSLFWNHHLVKAKRYFTKEEDGLVQPWSGRIFLNPPGTPDEERSKRSVPKLFWERLVGHWREQLIVCGFFVGFNMSQLQVLQMSPAHPLQFPTNFPGARLDYYEQPWEEVENPRVLVGEHTNKCIGKGGACLPACQLGKPAKVKRALAGPPRRQGAPPRPSYLTFLPPRDRAVAAPMVRRFVEGATRLDMVPGALTRPIV
jgi:hypothetical protein